MKKFFPVVAIFFSAAAFAQSSIDFQDIKFADLLAKAKKENKPVFLDAYASWCGPCKMLEKNIFPQEEVKDFFNQNFINAHYDMEKGEGPAIAARYGIRSYPTMLFLNGDGEVIAKGLGYMDAENLLQLARKSTMAARQNISPRKMFDSGESGSDFLSEIIRNNAESDYDFAKKAAERYFSVRKKGPFSKQEISYIFYFTRSASDPLFKFFVENKEEISKEITPATYAEFERNLKFTSVLENAVDSRSGVINEDYYFKNAVPLLGEAEAKRSLNRVKLDLYAKIGNTESLKQTAFEYFKNPDESSSEELTKAAYMFSQLFSDAETLGKAKVWAEKSVMKGETPENTLVLAMLSEKLGNVKDALMYAEFSQKLSASQGKDGSAALKLINGLKAEK